MIYLDNAATSKVKTEVIETMMPYFTERFYNPSSLYNPAAKISEEIKNARKTIGNFIGADGNEIYFVSSGSEANCWALQGFVNNKVGERSCIITSQIEHKSIIDYVTNQDGANAYIVDVDKDGFVDIDMLDGVISLAKEFSKSENILVSIQFANNEVGVIQKIKEISDIVHKHGAVFHTDAVQIFGQISIDVSELGIDMLSASGHKIGAPKGIGVLYKKNGININPLIYGSQMDNMRGGTENVPYIVGMAKAVGLCDFNNKTNQLCKKRDYFISQLESKFVCKLNGSRKCRLPNNINVTFPQNITGESLLYMLDLSGIAVSTGSACNSKSIEKSNVLDAIGLSDSDAMKTIRFTLPDDITYQEIDKVISEIDKCIKLIEMEN